MRQGIQTDFPHEMLREYGCYFFALLRWAELLRGEMFEFSDKTVLETFERCKHFGLVEDDCFIVNPVEILNFCLAKRRFTTVYKSIAMPNEGLFAMYLKKPGHGHFVLGCQAGILWDSLDPSRPGAKDYSVDSYRVVA